MTIEVAKQRLLNTAWLGTNEDRETTEEAVRVLIKAVEQEPILDKIRAEIDNITDTMGVSYNQYLSKIDVLQIIDKYRQEG